MMYLYLLLYGFQELKLILLRSNLPRFWYFNVKGLIDT